MQSVGKCCALGDAYTSLLRTAEFLWQEGHTAHATSEEAIEETMKMINVYANFAMIGWQCLLFRDIKPKANALQVLLTLCIEALMQDGKALQAGTSHFRTNFAKL